MITRWKTSQPRKEQEEENRDLEWQRGKKPLNLERKQEKNTRRKEGHPVPLKKAQPGTCKITNGSQVLSYIVK